jgi:hypothetical protein
MRGFLIRSTRMLMAAISYVEIPATQKFRVPFNACKEVLIFCRSRAIIGSGLTFYNRNRSSFERNIFTFIQVYIFSHADNIQFYHTE